MYYINFIKEVLNCDDKVAQDVLDNMGEYRLSTLTNTQLTRAIKRTYNTMNIVGGKA